MLFLCQDDATVLEELMKKSPPRLRKAVTTFLSGRRGSVRLQYPTLFLYPDILARPWHEPEYVLMEQSKFVYRNNGLIGIIHSRVLFVIIGWQYVMNLMQ